MPHLLKEKVEKDLFWINVLGIMLIVVVGLFPTSFVRTLIGVPFILFFPGYTLVSALFPKKERLDGIERLALSIGLSITVVPLLGLILNYTPFGVRLYPVLVSLFVFTFLMSVVTGYRRKGLDVKERFVPSFSVSVPRWKKMNRVYKSIYVGLIIGVVVSGALLFIFITTPRVGKRFTEFYVLGSGGKIEGYPTNLTLGQNSTVILGVVNHEYEEVDYSIIILLDNETIETIEDIRLMHDEGWEENYTSTPEKTGDEMKLEFLLFREDVIEPYRSLHLWITVKP